MAQPIFPARQNFRTSDVVEFGMSPFSWRRHSCLLGRDSSRPSSRAASTVPERREESSDLLRPWNWDEPGGGARLQPSPEGTPDFSPPAAGLTSLAGGRAEARRRLKRNLQYSVVSPLPRGRGSVNTCKHCDAVLSRGRKQAVSSNSASSELLMSPRNFSLAGKMG